MSIKGGIVAMDGKHLVNKADVTGPPVSPHPIVIFRLEFCARHSVDEALIKVDCGGKVFQESPDVFMCQCLSHCDLSFP
jgi:hypothetical protein